MLPIVLYMYETLWCLQKCKDGWYKNTKCLGRYFDYRKWENYKIKNFITSTINIIFLGWSNRDGHSEKEM
jgi:hypothetical protein